MFPVLEEVNAFSLDHTTAQSMASSENVDGSDSVGSHGGLLPAAIGLPYYLYPITLPLQPPLTTYRCAEMDIEVILKSMEMAILRLTVEIFPTELL